jgi:prepilin-type N-terminal cleavage/methylation domain-containing protein/prepilin-type processing-associated H-X9-DG protein
MGKKGFTLIELLVVIAIIAILAAILFPIFVKASEASRNSKCQNNLKQLTTAVQMYVDDNGGYFPKTRWHSRLHWIYNESRTPPEGLYLQDVLYTANRTPRIWLCPCVQPTGYSYRPGWGTFLWRDSRGTTVRGRQIVSNYIWNHVLEDPPGNTSKIIRNTWAMVFCEMPYWQGPTGTTRLHLTEGTGAVNMSFFDGHVKSIKQNDNAYAIWNELGWKYTSPGLGAGGQ